MDQNLFPTIDTAATGRNIQRLRKESGLTVRDLQDYFGFEDPQAIYRWQWGRSLPSVDNLYALSVLLHVPMNEILVPQTSTYHTTRKTADMAVFSLYCGFILSARHRSFHTVPLHQRSRGNIHSQNLPDKGLISETERSDLFWYHKM